MRSIMLLFALAAVPAMPSVAVGQDIPSPYLTPADAIKGAAADPKKGLRGTFKVLVKAWGADAHAVYLNSEEDYKDGNSISIELLDDSQLGMTRRFGSPEALKGKTILVTGVARRVKIFFLTKGGRLTGKYYFQTHIVVKSANQVQLLP